MAKRKASRGEVEYSETVPGETGNFGWAVKFDRTDNGFVGISQYHDPDMERVLLSPAQVAALVAFVGAKRKRSPAAR